MFSNPLGSILKDFLCGVCYVARNVLIPNWCYVVRRKMLRFTTVILYIPFQVNYKIQSLCAGSVRYKVRKERKCYETIAKVADGSLSRTISA